LAGLEKLSREFLAKNAFAVGAGTFFAHEFAAEGGRAWNGGPARERARSNGLILTALRAATGTTTMRNCPSSRPPLPQVNRPPGARTSTISASRNTS
jgi:hypothetical protein